MVRMRGLEPPRRKAPDPKSGVYTNFTTSACDFLLNNNKVVHPLGFEPKTLALEGRCSIQLSYECTKIINNKTDLLMVRLRGLEPLTLRSEV